MAPPIGIAAGVITALSAIIGAGAALYSAYHQFDAAEEAEDIARKNAKLAEAETEEEARRMEKEQDRISSLARARAFASGVDPTTGSVALYLEDLEETHRSELDWLKRTGAVRAEQLRERGEFAQAAGQAEGVSSLGSVFGYASDFYTGGVQAEWWK